MRPNELATNLKAVQRMQVGLRHGMLDLAEDSLLRGETDAVFRERLRDRIAVRMLGGSFAFARVITDLKTEYGVRGLEAEKLQDYCRSKSLSFDSRRPIIPWALLARDLTAASAGSGGFLVSTDTGEVIDILRPWSVTARAGITTLENLSGNVAFPRTASKTTGFWLSNEGTVITESQPTLGSIAISPKTVGGIIEFSRQIALQAATEQYIRNELLKTIGTMIDQAVLNGTGSGGQPTGLLNTSGLSTQSGTSLTYAGAVAMKTAAATANARDDAIAYITTPAVRGALETRERAAGSGFIWDDDKIASRPGYATTDVPGASMVCGDWSDVLLALWGDGFELSLNPFDQTKFAQGIVQARLAVSADVAVGHPSSFCVAATVT